MGRSVVIVARQIVTNSKGNPLEITRDYPFTWHTSTNTTVEIMQKDNPLEAYRDHVRSVAETRTEWHAEDFQERQDIVFGDLSPHDAKTAKRITIDEGKEHLDHLDQWIASQKEDGFDIEIFEV